MTQKEIKRRIEIKNDRLEMYYKAEKAILAGAQSYAIGSKNLTRASLYNITSEIEELESDIAELQAQLDGSGARKAFAVVPRDF